METKPSNISQQGQSKPSVKASISISAEPTPLDGERRSTAIPEQLRRRRCHFNPTCGCVLENTIYILIVIGTAIDLMCIGFWTFFAMLHDNAWNYHFARDTGLQLLVMHFFCLVFNFVLFFGTSMENVLLCLSWVQMRGIWYFAALVNWIRSCDVITFGGKFGDAESEQLGDEEKMVWILVFWGYWPLMIVYAWFTIIVVVFICRIITISERKRLMVRQVQGIPFTDVDHLTRISILQNPNEIRTN